jgi:hypothetical protein
MLLVLMFSVGFTISLSSLTHKPFTENKLIISSLIHNQINALYKHKSFIVALQFQTDYPVIYTSLGYINMGQTISIDNKTFVLMITSGRIHEKR